MAGVGARSTSADSRQHRPSQRALAAQDGRAPRSRSASRPRSRGISAQGVELKKASLPDAGKPGGAGRAAHGSNRGRSRDRQGSPPQAAPRA